MLPCWRPTTPTVWRSRRLKLIFEYLPACYDNGQNEPVAREKMGNAATMAGMAFANAFLGVCHSMAHKLGAFHHLPHGIANALLIELVIRYNSAEVPTKMGTFPQYAYPHTKRRYAEFGEFLGFKGANDDETVENLIRNIHALKERVGIKNTIRDYGVDEEKFLATLDEMVRAGVRRPVHRREPALPAHQRNQGNVPQGILRRVMRHSPRLGRNASAGPGIFEHKKFCLLAGMSHLGGE